MRTPFDRRASGKDTKCPVGVKATRARLIPATKKLGNSDVTRGPGGQQQTTTRLGNSYITRDNKTGTTLTTSPLGNSLQTRANGGSSYSTTQLGNSLITRETSSKKDDPQTRMIVLPRQSGQTQKP
jgi:hypothetical protein